jgi:hypothetical protein
MILLIYPKASSRHFRYCYFIETADSEASKVAYFPVRFPVICVGEIKM